MSICLDLDVTSIDFAFSYAKSGFFPNYDILPRAIRSYHWMVLAELTTNRPFLTPDFLPERALCYMPTTIEFFSSLGFGVVVPSTPVTSSSNFILNSDIGVMAFFLYNVTYFHLIFLGFIFTFVIVGVISLLLNRNLRVRRQRSFDQNAISLVNSVKIS